MDITCDPKSTRSSIFQNNIFLKGKDTSSSLKKEIWPVNLCDIMHLFPLHRVIWRFVHPRKVIFLEGNIHGKYDYFEGEQIFISPLCKGNECFIPPGQRFGEFYQMKSFGHLCLQNYYFGTSLDLSLITWNTVIWPKP